jgi:hypothetical protein
MKILHLKFTVKIFHKHCYIITSDTFGEHQRQAKKEKAKYYILTNRTRMKKDRKFEIITRKTFK